MRAVGTAVLWLVVVPMIPLVVVLGFIQHNDEVNANSTTTGTVTRHVTNPEGPTYECWFKYTVAGAEYQASDDCSHVDNPVGSTVTVNHADDKPAAGFLHGDKSWWDKLGTVAIVCVVIAGIWGAVFVVVRRLES